MKKLVFLLLAVFMLSLSFTALAEEGIVPYASEYFDSYSIAITPKDGARLNVRFSTTAVEESYSLGVSTFQLQKKVDGEFVDVGEEQSGSIGYGVVEHTFTRSCQGVAGTVYRVKATFVCGNSKGFKSQTYYSGSIAARD